MSQQNIHATALVVGETGLLVTGPPASGKSRIARQCLHDAHGRGRFGALVADDRVLAENVNGRLIASAPDEIAGLIEIRGSGIVGVDHLPRAVMHIAISAVRPDKSQRLPEARLFEPVPGIQLPLLFMVAEQVIDPLELVEAVLEGRLIRS